MSHHGEKKSDATDKQPPQGEKTEKAASKARGETDSVMGSLGAGVKKQRQQQRESGESGVTGKGDKNAKFRSAKDILGDFAHAILSKDAESKLDTEFRAK